MIVAGYTGLVLEHNGPAHGGHETNFDGGVLQG
jgi:hypothetical protein